MSSQRLRPALVAEVRAMQQTFAIPVRELVEFHNKGDVGAGPVLVSAILLGREDKVPGPTGTKVAILTRKLKQAFAECCEDLQQLLDNYTQMRPKLVDGVPVIENGATVMEKVPFVKEYTRKAGTPDAFVERIEEPNRYVVKEGYDAALKAMLATDVEVVAVGFTLEELDALAIKPEIKEGLLVFLNEPV